MGTLAAYTVYKLMVSAQARPKAILFLIGVIVVIVVNALERWLFWWQQAPNARSGAGTGPTAQGGRRR